MIAAVLLRVLSFGGGVVAGVVGTLLLFGFALYVLAKLAEIDEALAEDDRW